MQPPLAQLRLDEEEPEVYHAEVAGPVLPDRPPFKVYVSNVPYELDEAVVERHFKGLQVGKQQGSLLPGWHGGGGRAWCMIWES